MVGQHILYKWHGYGWCQGIITKWNDNPATVMEIDRVIINLAERDNVVYWKTKRKINDDLQPGTPVE